MTRSQPKCGRCGKRSRDATGLVFATPEYHGTYSSVTKLIIENLGFPSVLATKPVALLGRRRRSDRRDQGA